LVQKVSYQDQESNLQKRLKPSTSQASDDLFTETKTFMFSGISFKDKTSMEQVIHKLGGMVNFCDTWEGDCTHLIVATPQKTEKYLCALASCSW
jgi:hypothetical protein